MKRALRFTALVAIVILDAMSHREPAPTPEAWRPVQVIEARFVEPDAVSPAVSSEWSYYEPSWDTMEVYRVEWGIRRTFTDSVVWTYSSWPR